VGAKRAGSGAPGLAREVARHKRDLEPAALANFELRNPVMQYKEQMQRGQSFALLLKVLTKLSL